jgi:hypothetical protein
MNAAIVFPHIEYATGNRPHPAREIASGSTYQVPQGLTYLYSTLRHMGMQARVLDFNFRSFEENLARVQEIKPDVVLVTSTVNSYDSTREIVGRVADSCADARIFVGGPSVALNVPTRAAMLAIDAPFEYRTHERIYPEHADTYRAVRSQYLPALEARGGLSGLGDLAPALTDRACAAGA